MPLYLIAILTPASIDKQVLEWKEFMLKNFGCKVALKSPAHITLVPPFRLSLEQKQSLKDALENFSGTQPDFQIDLHNFSAFPPGVIFVEVVNNISLQSTKTAIEDFLLAGSYPIKKDSRPFHPHITIANRDLEKTDFKHAMSIFEKKPFEASFHASAISLLRHDGKKWEIDFVAPLGRRES